MYPLTVPSLEILPENKPGAASGAAYDSSTCCLPSESPNFEVASIILTGCKGLLHSGHFNSGFSMVRLSLLVVFRPSNRSLPKYGAF